MNKSLSTTALTLTAVLTLGGCGGGGDQDSGSSSGGGQSDVGGVAVDGYLARAVVYVDLNENDQLDAFESRALTDNQGYFTYNPRTEVDYCAGDATPRQQKHCLRSNLGDGDGTLVRIVGGYDTVTGQPFDGTLTLNSAGATDLTAMVASPLTSLLASAGDRRAALLDKLGSGGVALTEAQAGRDYFDGEVDSELLRLALQSHKIVAVLADLIEDQYGKLGDERGLPADASGLVYTALVTALLDTDTDFATFIGDVSALTSVLGDAENAVRALYADEELSLPTQLSDASVTARAEAAARIGQAVDAVVDDVVNNTKLSAAKRQRAAGSARAVEVIVKKVLADDGDYADAAEWATQQSQDVANLGKDNMDINTLVEGDMDPNNGSHASDASIPHDAVHLTNFVGSRLAMSYSDSDERGAVLMYFTGEENDADGELQVCIRYTSNDDDDLDTDGLMLNGDWSFPNGTGNPYLMLLTAEVLGSQQAMMIRSVGLNSSNEAVFRFDFGDDVETWAGRPTPDTFDPDNVPAGDEECRTRLVNEFGQF